MVSPVSDGDTKKEASFVAFGRTAIVLTSPFPTSTFARFPLRDGSRITAAPEARWQFRFKIHAPLLMLDHMLDHMLTIRAFGDLRLVRPLLLPGPQLDQSHLEPLDFALDLMSQDGG